MLEGIGLAREMLPGMNGRTILHAGPPIAWERMCGPMQGAIIGAILFEGWAEDAETARARGGERRDRVRALPSPRRRRPMAGIISPSMPVWIVREREQANLSFCNLNEGLGKVLRFGANGPEVIDRLEWMATVLRAGARAALGSARARSN